MNFTKPGIPLGLTGPSQTPFPETGFAASAYSKTESLGLKKVALQHLTPSLLQERRIPGIPTREGLCLMDRSLQRGHCWISLIKYKEKSDRAHIHQME